MRKRYRYHYNPKTLNYERVRVSTTSQMMVALAWICTSLVFGFVIVVVFTLYFESPRDRMHNKEMSRMKHEYRRMEKAVEEMSVALHDIQLRDENIYRVMLDASPLSDEIRNAGFGGRRPSDNFEGFSNAALMSRMDSMVKRLDNKIKIQSRSFRDLENLMTRQEERNLAVPYIQPVDNKDLTRIASGFGMRFHPILKVYKMHEGLDFTAPIGTEIYATGGGIVRKASFSRGGYGNMVKIDHGFGYSTLYAHMSTINVRVGQKVKRGEIIGRVGNTGRSTGPHLHYEVIKDGRKVNPVLFFHGDLEPDAYAQVIERANATGKSLD